MDLKKNLVFFILIFFSSSIISLAQELPGYFKDIPSGTKFSFPLNYLKEQKIIENSADENFRPGKKIKREEALTMILKTAAKIQNKVLQEASTVFMKTYEKRRRVSLAEALRLLFHYTETNTQVSESSLPPGISSNDWFAKDIGYAVSRSLITQGENGEIFPPGKNLARGEMVLLLYRFLKTAENATFGYATWYGDGLAKTKLKSGIEYAEKFLTAAHRTIPFGTIVLVTNMNNGNQVKVVINDRGPFVRGRIIDLSKTAFSVLENPERGIIPVQIEVLP